MRLVRFDRMRLGSAELPSSTGVSIHGEMHSRWTNVNVNGMIRERLAEMTRLISDLIDSGNWKWELRVGKEEEERNAKMRQVLSFFCFLERFGKFTAEKTN